MDLIQRRNAIHTDIVFGKFATEVNTTINLVIASIRKRNKLVVSSATNIYVVPAETVTSPHLRTLKKNFEVFRANRNVVFNNALD